MKTQGWNAKKVKVFRAAFLDFLKHVQIASKDIEGYQPLQLYEAQQRLLDEIFDGLENDIRTFVVLKARQLGISTVVRALIVFWAFMNEGLRVALVYDKEINRDAAHLEIKQFLERLPPSHSIPISKHNRNLLEFKNGSTIFYFVAGVTKGKGSGGLGRSVGIACAGCTEMSSWGDIEGLKSFNRSVSQQHPNRLYIWESPLALDTPVPSPRGWTTIGKIKEGHYVYDEHGKPCRVNGESPVFLHRKCFKITFSNGETIVADGRHKWQVMERRWPTNPQWKIKVITTEDLDPEKHRIEMPHPLEMADIDLPIDPYLLGVWLGDGTSGQVAITTGDEDIAEIRQLLEERGCALGPVSKNNWRVGKFTILGQRTLFIRLGLLNNKHIPRAYLRASERQRRELLAGLMDTDGHISEDNFRCEFANSSPRLIDDVAELLASLGIKFNRSVLSTEGKLRRFPNGQTYACAASERLRFCEHPDLQVFNLARKKSVQSTKRGYTHRKAKYLKIVSIEETPSVPVKCISVDTPTHLFLVGKTMLPTHNTARGFNIFHDIWEDAKADDLAKRAIFIGWWAKETYRLPKGTALFQRYGAAEPDAEELKKIALVQERYGHEVDQEQLAWYRHEHDPNIEKQETDKDGADLTAQELPWYEEEAWVMTGASFFPGDELAQAWERAEKTPVKGYRYFMSQEFFATVVDPVRVPRQAVLRVWEEPDPDGVYVIGADPAYGASELADRHCAQVLRCYADGVDQVAEFCTTTAATYQFAWVLAHLCGAYGNARLLLEINGPGQAVLNGFRELELLVRQGYLQASAQEAGLTNIFASVKHYMYARQDSIQRNPTAFHWVTTTRLKVTILERLRDHFNTGALRVNSVEALREMQTIRREGDEIGGEGSNKDDRVIALALAVRAWEDSARKPLIAARRTRDFETKQRTMTSHDLYNLFMERQLGSFFDRTQNARLQAARAAKRGTRYNF